jgi:cytochrome P450
MRDPVLYPDPEAFNPARWLDPSFPTYKEPLTHYPQIKNHSGFGWGKRTCIGQDYSEQVLLTIIAGILWSCTITKKRDPKTGLEKEVPWLDYGPYVIVRPEGWELDILPRSASRVRMLAE